MHEIRQRIVWHILVEHRSDAVRRRIRHHHEMRVSAALRDDIGSHQAAGTGLVIDHDRLAELAAEIFILSRSLAEYFGWPSLLPKYSASERERMSAAPAGGKLTIQRIGLEGQPVCARAMPGAARAEAARKVRRESMIALNLL